MELSYDNNSVDKQKQYVSRLKQEETFQVIQLLCMLLLFLLLVGLFLFIPLYSNDARNDSFGALNATLQKAIGQLIIILQSYVKYLQSLLGLLPIFFAQPHAPFPSLVAPNGSLFVDTNSQVIYIEQHSNWTPVFNSSYGVSNASCSSCPIPLLESYQGIWNASYTYQPGNIVEFNTILYITETFNTTIVQPGFNDTIWIPYVGNITGVPGYQGPQGANGTDGPSIVADGSWSNSTYYLPGSVVLVNNTLYLAQQNNTDAFPPTNPYYWSSILSNITLPRGPKGITGPQGPPGENATFVGPWSANASYTVGNVVVYNNDFYLSIVTNNTNIAPNTNQTVWLPLSGNITAPQGPNGINGTDGISYVYEGKWSSNQTYIYGDVVTYLNFLYTANSTNADNLPFANSTTWRIAIPETINPAGANGTNGTNGVDGPDIVFGGNWNNSAYYISSQLVVYNQSIYQSLTNNTNVTPGSNTSTWDLILPQFYGVVGPAGTNGINGTSYIFLGEWNSTISYARNIDYVTFNSVLYLALQDNINSPPTYNSSIWQQVTYNVVYPNGTRGPMGNNGTFGTGFTYAGNWNASETYDLRTFVTYNQTLFLSLNSSVGQNPEANQTFWLPVYQPIVGTSGNLGHNGTDGANGQSYSFTGLWNATANYVVGDLVLQNDSLWSAVANSTGIIPENSTSSFWSLQIPNLTGGITGPVGPMGLSGRNGTAPLYIGQWNTFTNYSTMDVVLYNQSIYLALTYNYNQPPSTNSSTWAFLVGAFKGIGGPVGPPGLNATNGLSYVYVGLWNSSQSYIPGNAVTLADGSLYTALVNSSNQYPTTSSTFWTLRYGNISGLPGASGEAGTNATLQGNWNNTVSYAKGNIVFFNNFLYLAKLPNINVEPDTNSTVWTLQIGYINATGATGAQGSPAPPSGIQTIRLMRAGPPFRSTSIQTVVFQGVYDLFSDTTYGGGDLWGNFSISDYYPATVNGSVTGQSLVLRSTVALRLDLVSGALISTYLRIDASYYTASNTSTSGTLCTTNGYTFPSSPDSLNGTAIPFNSSYSYIAYVSFEYTIANSLQNSGLTTCSSVQRGDIGMGSNLVTTTYLLDYPNLQLPLSFTFKGQFVTIDPSLLCTNVGNVPRCAMTPLYAKHTLEVLSIQSVV